MRVVGTIMDKARQAEFERNVLPHLGAAYSLARWLLRHPQDAEDAVQEAVLRAYRAFDAQVGGSPAAWFLTIVRNTCLTALERRRSDRNVIVLDDIAQAIDRTALAARGPAAPPQDEAMIAEEQRRRVHGAIAALPDQYREVIVLREFHELSYREIAEVVGAPIGTVMSRLARARDRLKDALLASEQGEGAKSR